MKSLDFRYAQGLADHRGGPGSDDDANHVELTATARLAPDDEFPKGNTALALDEAFLGPIRQDTDEEEGRGDGEALEVLGFAGAVFGDEGNGSVESGETGEATADEAGEADGVEVGAEADDEGEEGGRDAEGDLGSARDEYFLLLPVYWITWREEGSPSQPSCRAPAPGDW